MKKSVLSIKLTELLKTFSEDEFKEFGQYISSPFFNTESAQEKLYLVLKKYYPAFEGRDLNREKVFQKLYPEKKYHDGIMRNLLSRTLALAQDFLAVKRFLTDRHEFGLARLHELNSRKQYRLFENNYNDLLRILDGEKVRSSDFYFAISRLYTEKRNYGLHHKSSLKFDEENIGVISHSHVVSFLINVLYINVLIMNAHKYYFDEYKQYGTLLKGVIDHITENYELYRDITYLNYYYNAYLLAKTGEEKYYYSLKELKSKSDEMYEGDKSELHSVLANYCYTKINKGELGFLKEQFEVYRDSIEKGIYTKNLGYISHLYYINIVITGLEAGETQWVRNFIAVHKHELDDINRENTYIFCLALYSYWMKDYTASLDLAAKVKTDDSSYKHQLKSLYLKIYYELNEVEPFYSHVDSYRHFIAADPNTGETLRTAISNYINFSKKLFDMKSSTYDKTGLDLLKRDIVKNKAMINKPWLLRMIENLEKTLS